MQHAEGIVLLGCNSIGWVNNISYLVFSRLDSRFFEPYHLSANTTRHLFSYSVASENVHLKCFRPMTALVPPLICTGVCIHLADLSKDQRTNELVKGFVGFREVCKIFITASM